MNYKNNRNNEPEPPIDDHRDPAISIKRKGFYIILLLGITAIGIYAVLSAILPDNDTDRRIETGAAYSTPSPYRAAVPANAPAVPQTDDDDVDMPTAIPTDSAESGSAETALDTEPGNTKGQAPVSGRIIKDYSADELVYFETMNDWRAHCGVDIGAAPDTFVTAIKDGTLKKVYEDSMLGTTVMVHHSDDGTDSVYSNLKDVPDLPIGSEIKMGDILGKVGSTAILEQSEPAHLHFEIRRDEEPLDPKEFVTFEEVDYITPEPSGGPSAAETSNTTIPSDEPEDTETSSTAYSPDPYTDGEDIETMIID